MHHHTPWSHVTGRPGVPYNYVGALHASVCLGIVRPPASDYAPCPRPAAVFLQLEPAVLSFIENNRYLLPFRKHEQPEPVVDISAEIVAIAWIVEIKSSLHGHRIGGQLHGYPVFRVCFSERLPAEQKSGLAGGCPWSVKSLGNPDIRQSIIGFSPAVNLSCVEQIHSFYRLQLELLVAFNGQHEVRTVVREPQCGPVVREQCPRREFGEFPADLQAGFTVRRQDSIIPLSPVLSRQPGLDTVVGGAFHRRLYFGAGGERHHPCTEYHQ